MFARVLRSFLDQVEARWGHRAVELVTRLEVDGEPLAKIVKRIWKLKICSLKSAIWCNVKIVRAPTYIRDCLLCQETRHVSRVEVSSSCCWRLPCPSVIVKKPWHFWVALFSSVLLLSRLARTWVYTKFLAFAMCHVWSLLQPGLPGYKWLSTWVICWAFLELLPLTTRRLSTYTCR